MLTTCCLRRSSSRCQREVWCWLHRARHLTPWVDASFWISARKSFCLQHLCVTVTWLEDQHLSNIKFYWSLEGSSETCWMNRSESQGLILFLQDQEKFVSMKWLSYFLKCDQVSYQSGLLLPPNFIIERAKSRRCDKSLDLKFILCDDFDKISTAFSGLHWETQIMTLGKWQNDQKVTQQWTALAFFQTTWLELDLYSCEIK